MPVRPALRAALVVSGLTVGCGGTATLEEQSTTTSGSGTSDTSGDATNDGSSTVATAPCERDVEPTTEACCNEQGGRGWDASSGTCVWMAVPGPFVPPAMSA